MAGAMNRFRYAFLAGAGVAGDQDMGVASCDLLDVSAQMGHGGTGADDGMSGGRRHRVNPARQECGLDGHVPAAVAPCMPGRPHVRLPDNTCRSRAKTVIHSPSRRVGTQAALLPAANRYRMGGTSPDMTASELKLRRLDALAPSLPCLCWCVMR